MSSRLFSLSPEIMPLKFGSSLGMAQSAILADVSDMERDILQILHVNNLIKLPPTLLVSGHAACKIILILLCLGVWTKVTPLLNPRNISISLM